ncbi:unnamed protein product, partial [Ceratitis capitata]
RPHSAAFVCNMLSNQLPRIPAFDSQYLLPPCKWQSKCSTVCGNGRNNAGNTCNVPQTNDVNVILLYRQ